MESEAERGVNWGIPKEICENKSLLNFQQYYEIFFLCRSAFLFFSAQKRPQLKSANPKASNGDHSKQLSSEWKQMTDEEKEPYIKMADRDKERYHQQKVAFNAGYHAARLQEDNLLFGLTEDMENKKKNPDMPKRNM